MIGTSTLYNQILAQANHSVEWKITVNGVTYGEDKIDWSIAGGDSRPRITKSLFTGSAPEVGACVANRFSCAIFEASSAIPRMAAVVPYYRLVYGNLQSEWVQKGVYYIDTRKPDKASGSLILECYDAMLKADGEGGKPYSELTEFTEWPQHMDDVVDDICTILGVELDSRTTIQDYDINYPNDYTMREVLGYIAAAHGGCFTMTDAGKLRLVTLTGNGEGVSVGWSIKALSDPPALVAWSGVDMYYADEQGYQSGDDTGRVLSCDCPWATQEIADDVLAVISGESYQPFSASGVILDLAAELGDTIQIGGTGDYYTGTLESCIFSVDTICDSASYSGVQAPGEEELDHEYPYASYVDRTLKRKVGLAVPYYGVTITKTDGLKIARSDGKSEAIFNSDVFEMDALIDGVMVPRIYFDPAKGDFVFDGALGANAIFTDSLYAESGDVSELTVDRLSTAKRIRKFLLQDTSDDNFVEIQDYYMRFISGSVIGLYNRLITEDELDIITEDGDYLDAETNGTASYEQAKNRYGQNLYWEQDISNATISAQGYPFVDGRQVYTTTGDTGYPVYVYKYNDLIKAEYAFTQIGDNYVPVQTWGAGSGYGNYGKGFIQKLANMFKLSYITRSGANESIEFNDDGWVDINTMRKPLRFDFSQIDSGTFLETIDGGTEYIYTVGFDEQGRISSIRDGAGHLTEVIW